MLVHIRDGKVIRRYQGETGWVILADGRRVSPPVAGFKDGPDMIVPMVVETIDDSTRASTVTTRETVIEKDRVIDRVVIEDAPVAQLVAEVKAEAKARADTTQPADARLEMLAEFAAATLAHGADPALWPADVRSKVQAGVADWEKVKAIRAKAEQIAAMKTIPADLKDEKLWQADGKAVK